MRKIERPIKLQYSTVRAKNQARTKSALRCGWKQAAPVMQVYAAISWLRLIERTMSTSCALLSNNKFINSIDRIQPSSFWGETKKVIFGSCDDWPIISYQEFIGVVRLRERQKSHLKAKTPAVVVRIHRWSRPLLRPEPRQEKYLFRPWTELTYFLFLFLWFITSLPLEQTMRRQNF